jgi:hypothetical protein
MMEMSTAEKVEKLGFDRNEFWDDMSKIDDLINFDYSEKNLEKNVFPYLRKLKAKYGFDIPIGLFGVDVIKLDERVDRRLREVI